MRRCSLLLAGLLVVAACGSSEPTTAPNGNSSAGDSPPGIDVVVDEAPAAPDDDGQSGAGEADSSEAPESTETPEQTAPPVTILPADAPTAAPGDAANEETREVVELTGPLPTPSVGVTTLGMFQSPVEVTSRPGDNRVLVVEQPGRVLAVDDLSETVLADISDIVRDGGEQGLLGLAYHPTDPLAYVYYTNASGDSVVAEYVIDAATGVFDPATARELLQVAQPFSNHNGGELAFGPDGMLYIGLGDGGSADDPERASLDLNSLLGKILRIDPRANGDDPYSVPADNPYVGLDGARPEIWSSGLRNPWRLSFDTATGDLWIADVGQRAFEEINVARASDGAGRGASFGWSAFEGFEPFNADQAAAAEAVRPDGQNAQVSPAFVYSHSDGNCSVSGGAVARGGPIADLAGWYVFGDYCSGRIWGYDTTSPVDEPRVIELSQFDALAAIATGPDGTLYAVSNGGPIAALVPA